MNPARFLKSSYFGSCAYYLLSNYARAVRFRSGDIQTNSGARLAGRDPDSSLAYIQKVFADYRHHAGLLRFYGRVAELGPGDNCGVALLFLADGCDCVDLADRFFSRRDSENNAVVYKLLASCNQHLQDRLGQANFGDEETFNGIHRFYGQTAASERFFDRGECYDFIVSRAVLEHVQDPVLSLRKMAAALNPGGQLLHRVDLRDHALFSTASHELKFLEVPDWLYPAMTKHSGRPNRVLIHEYRTALRASLPDHDILVTRLAGVGPIEPNLRYADIDAGLRAKAIQSVRSRRRAFAQSLKNVCDEDLSVAGIFIVGRKPA